MENLLKSKTRLTFIQIIFENLSTKNDVSEIFQNYESKYKNIFVENFHDKKIIKFEFNSNFLKKLVNFYKEYTKKENYTESINKFINFNRSFQKWDIINQSILLAILCELNNTEENKIKIVLNDYLNVGKSFIDDNEVGTINAIIDKIIYGQK